MIKGCCAVLAFGMVVTPLPVLAKGVNDMIKGDLEGEIGVYWQREKPRDEDAGGFALGYAAFLYESEALHGFSLGIGARGSVKLYERNDDEYEAAIAEDFIIPNGFLRYRHDELGSLTVGRQEVDLEWLNDYVEAGMLQLSPMDELDVNLGWARRQAVIDPDEVTDFEKMNDSRGLYVLDVKYSPVDWLELNPYYYHAPKMFQAPGLKVSAEFELAEDVTTATMGQFASSSPHDDTGEDNGNLFWLDQGLTFHELAVNAGYIKVNSKGAGMLDSFGDQQPLEEGNQVFAPDARTLYLGAGYEIGPVTLAAIYAETHYDDSGVTVKEKELNLVAGYEIIENLELNLIYVKVDNDDQADSYYAVKTGLTYRF
jgi:hypothetical protein